MDLAGHSKEALEGATREWDIETCTRLLIMQMQMSLFVLAHGSLSAGTYDVCTKRYLPRRARSSAYRIAQLVKTLVDLAIQMAIVNGLKR